MAEIKSGASATKLTVDPTSLAARSTLYDDAGNLAMLVEGAEPATVAGAVIMAMNDRTALPLRSDRFGSLSIALHTPHFSDNFEGATINPLRWRITAATMAATQSSVAGVTINSASITTASAGYMLQSAKRFVKTMRHPLQAKFRARLSHFNNSVMELGFGDASTAVAVNTTGAYWQRQSGGALVPVLTYNSVDITGSNVAGSLNNNDYYTFEVMLDDDEATFVIQNTSTGATISKQRIPLPASGQSLWSATALPALVRLYNTGTPPSSAPQLILTTSYVAGLDANYAFPSSDLFASMDRGPVGNPFTGAQLAQWTNSAEPTNATLSNTAAGYTTLGGKFQFAAPAGAVTDFALFGFQVPAPSNLLVTGVDIESWNTVAAVATTPHLLTWALATGAVAVTLASGTPTRVGLGAQSFPVAAAVGATAVRISKQFRTPLFVASGRFLHVILRIPVGTATATQVIAGMVNIEGYFV